MLREDFARLAHEQWAGWMEYIFEKGVFNKDGTWTMPVWAVARWKKQMETPYSELSESEQESDRKEADRFLDLIKMCSKCKSRAKARPPDVETCQTLLGVTYIPEGTK